MDETPVDGGMALLLTTAAAYGITKLREDRHGVFYNWKYSSTQPVRHYSDVDIVLLYNIWPGRFDCIGEMEGKDCV